MVSGAGETVDRILGLEIATGDLDHRIRSVTV
jgi:hypothetical protein